jgi:ABC-type amino acid transport substrate-binding protein
MVQPPLVPEGPGEPTPSPDPTKADIAFPLIPISEDAVRQNAPESPVQYSYTNPYFVGHQRLLVPSDSSITDVKDLGGKKLCQTLDPITDVDVATLEPSVETVTGEGVNGCAKLLAKGKVDAATASDVVLAGWALGVPGSKIVGEQINTAGYGAVVQAAASSWKEYVNAQFGEMKFEGRWAAAYEEWLADSFGPAPEEPPDMTTEEAAALYPKPKAESTP